MHSCSNIYIQHTHTYICRQLKQLSCLQVSHTNPGRVVSQRIPPAVPVRNRKSSTTDEESTQNSMASNSAQHSTIAQYSHHIQTNPFLPDPNYGQSENHKYGKNNPFVDQNISGNNITINEPYQSERKNTMPEQPKISNEPYHFHGEPTSKANLATPPAIPPPPVRSRRASTAFQNYDTYLDPRNSVLNQRRSSSPFQNYSGIIENDLSKSYSQSRNNSLVNSPYNSHSQINSLHNSQKQLNSQHTSSNSLQMKETEDKTDSNDLEIKKGPLVSQPTIILPNNYHELQRQSILNKENSQKNKMSQFKITHNTFLSETTCGGKSPNSQKPLLNHSTTESSESGIGTLGSNNNGISGDKSPPGSKVSVRQDSNVSSDSMSQTSSPSYTTKTMETPLLLHHTRKVGILYFSGHLACL